ncbi:hypothetical protein ACIGEL_17830 [Rossellomorea aquimaris]|uniref:hypothetical protein n=1 Tax=Rossellomorea aquimaris TaxID=189382 RepID=UPI0037CC0E0E
MSSEDFITICHQSQSTGNDPGDWPFFGKRGDGSLDSLLHKEEASEPSSCFFWTEETVQRFKEDIMRDIIETEPALFRNFAIKLLGGIK